MTNILGRLTKRTTANAPGQVMIEFLLVLPVIVMLLLVTIDFARAVYSYSVISDAARVGAHWGSLHPLNPDGTLNKRNGDNSIEGQINKKVATLDRSLIQPDITCIPLAGNPYQVGQTRPPDSDKIAQDIFDCASWNKVRVAVSYTFVPIIFPLGKFTLKTESTMTIE